MLWLDVCGDSGYAVGSIHEKLNQKSVIEATLLPLSTKLSLDFDYFYLGESGIVWFAYIQVA